MATTLTSFFHFRASIWGGLNFLLAVVGSIKTRALKNNPCAAGDKPFHFGLALGAFNQRIIRNLLEGLKGMAAARAFVFVGWHVFLAFARQKSKIKM